MVKSFPFDQVFIEAAQCGEREPDIRSGHPVFHAVKQKGAELLCGAVYPRCLSGREMLEFRQGNSIGNDSPRRGISFDMKILQVALKKPVLFWVRHAWEQYTTRSESER